jgi:hypothetical protein
MQNDYRAIRDLAYQLWQARGCPEGSAEQDWIEAERQISSVPTLSPADDRPPKVAAPVRVKRKARTANLKNGS